jgi:hypothetical protein
MDQSFDITIRSAMGVALALAVHGCSFDTRPAYDQAAAPRAAGAGAVNPVAPPGAPLGGQVSLSVEDGSPTPNPANPPVSDPPLVDAAAIADPAPLPLDAGVTGVPAEPQPPGPDAGDMAPSDPGSSGLLDDLRDWLANSPRVLEAEALRRIMAAIAASSGGTPDVPDAVNALGDVDCRRNARTCVSVCSWAVLNCQYCSNDAACVADLSQNCNRSCP